MPNASAPSAPWVEVWQASQSAPPVREEDEEAGVEDQAAGAGVEAEGKSRVQLLQQVLAVKH